MEVYPLVSATGLYHPDNHPGFCIKKAFRDHFSLIRDPRSLLKEK